MRGDLERVSFYQFLVHIRSFAVNPFLRKKQPMASAGRSFTPAAGEARKRLPFWIDGFGETIPIPRPCGPQIVYVNVVAGAGCRHGQCALD